jgi:hypothetical protein
MKDSVVVPLLLVTFALAVTVHVAIVFGLLRRSPRWHALVALVVPPFAPYWAWREDMRIRASLWMGAVVVYVVMLLLASRGP